MTAGFIRLYFAVLVAAFVFLPTTAMAWNCTTITANGINNWFPFSYRTDDGQLTGIVVDGMREALKRSNIQLHVQRDKPWKRMLHEIDIHQLDAILGVYWNMERSRKFLYTSPLGQDEVRIFVKKGKEFPFTNWHHLKGRSGLRLLGGSLGDRFDNFARDYLTFMEVNHSDTMITMLGNDRGDYGLLGYIEGLKFTKNLGLDTVVIPLETPALSQALHAIIDRHAACALNLDSINAAIASMIRDGKLDTITRTHLRAVTQ